jgi:hypothetical protein
LLPCEALTKQDLFINSALANLGAPLLWTLFREGMLSNRGFFLNLRNFARNPLKSRKRSTMHIIDLNGKKIEITDLPLAILQADDYRHYTLT